MRAEGNPVVNGKRHIEFRGYVFFTVSMNLDVLFAFWSTFERTIKILHLWFALHTVFICIFVIFYLVLCCIIKINKYCCCVFLVYMQSLMLLYKQCLQPRAGSGVVRTDPLRFLSGCRTRRLNQV